MLRTDIERYWREVARLAETMPYAGLTAAGELLLDCHRRGGTIFIIGNGGSAATASHMACDLSKGTRAAGLTPFRVVALTDNVPLLTAWANDTDYERVFAEQLAALVRNDDLLLVISASGNSPNVLAASEVAQQHGATTIAFTGASGGYLRLLADLTVRVPSENIEQVEDAHMIIAHSLCVALRERLRTESEPLALELGR